MFEIYTLIYYFFFAKNGRWAMTFRMLSFQIHFFVLYNSSDLVSAIYFC
jgi:hypothetical protein